MFGPDKTWQLDSRLEADTIFLWSNDDWQTRLLNDRRWPWIIVVPVRNDCVDIEDLEPATHAGLMQHLAGISKTLKAMGVATSSNVATIGNIVTQMHWHVIGRNEGDPNWPGPVWGFGQREPYTAQEAQAFIADFNAAWKKTVPLLNRF